MTKALRKWGCAAWVIPLGLSGCLTYGPSQLGAMSTYDICETQAIQAANMTEESRRLVRSELERRKESCAPHQAAIRAQLAEDLYDRTYRNQSP